MPSATAKTKKARKILLVEDEPDMCLLLNIMLTGDDMEVDHVNTLSAARDYFNSGAPSVLILDNRLPDGLGIDFISDIRKDFPETKIIMISGADAAAKDLALENGANEFLTKPFTKNQLYTTVIKQFQ
jgi:DNA-binding response OmpR family regulator